MAAVSAKPETPVFSYAQAAKGLSSSQSSSKTSSAEQTKTVSTPEEPDTVPKSDDSETKPEKIQSSATETPREAEKKVLTGVTVKKESEPTVAASQQSAAAAPSSKPATSGTYSPSAGTASTAKDDDSSSAAPNGTSESTWDKQSQASGTEKPSSGAEDSKEKADSSAEKSAPPKELKAAPIPPVNIWQQRKEAQNAKAKTLAALKPAAASHASNKSSKASSPAPSVAGESSQQDQAKTASKKKGTDSDGGNVQGAAKDRKKADGGKGRDDGFIPPVEDASSWPTPQIAKGEEMKRAQEKTEKSEKSEKSPVIRSHGKEKWTPVPYVPTAVFSTPLPSAARRGGRAARGGRDGGRGGGAHGPSTVGGNDKASSGSGAQVTAAKQSTATDGGRNEPNGARANTLSAQSRRSNSADPTSQSELRKVGQASDRGRGDGRGKGTDDATTGTVGRQTNGGDTFPRHQKSFARNHEFAFQKNGDHPRNSAHGPGDSTGPRPGFGHDRRFENAAKSADFHHRQFPQVDAHGRDFHKDKDHPRERGEPRFERGGRGSHRGRGGHSTYNPASQHSHFSNTHMPHSFVPHKPFGFNDRQRSHNGFPNGSQQQRLPLRSPSMPATSPAPVYGVYPFPSDASGMYGYPFMPAPPMSAVPYQPYMEPFSLMSMISMQLEYYFSVDNLCKDMFLRKHMDSQGFVPLSFIAGFKRIKSLTEDFDLLRHVSRQLRNVEHQTGGDGIDRLRQKEKWAQWVLPLGQRDVSAQNEGPPPPPANPGKPGENAVLQNNVDGESGAPATTNGLNLHGPGKPMLNGTSGPRTTLSPLSSTAPEFLPSNPVTTQNENTNVGIPVDNPPPFPDDQVEKLVIVVRKLGNPSQQQPHILNDRSSRFCYSNGSVDALNTAGGLAAPHRTPFLHRPEDLACSSSINLDSQRHPYHIRNARPGDETAKPRCQSPIFWVQERDNPREKFSSDFVHELYSDFRKRALDKRSLMSTQDGDHDMAILYRFWSHFLVQNFHAQMYSEFRSLALDDLSTRNTKNGYNRLVDFYGSFLSSNKLVPEVVARDLVDLVKKELRSQDCYYHERVAFRTLHLAWRDDSFNPKTRKRIDSVLDAGLRAELEK